MIGHNQQLNIAAWALENGLTGADLIAAGAAEIHREYLEKNSEIIERFQKLAANVERMPEQLNDQNVGKAAALLEAMLTVVKPLDETHDAIKKLVNSSIEPIMSVVKATSKNLENGVQPVRDKIQSFIGSEITAANTADANVQPLTSKTHKVGGLNLTVTTSLQAKVDDATLVPAGYTLPNIKLINEAIKGGKNVPGVTAENVFTLRVTAIKN